MNEAIRSVIEAQDWRIHDCNFGNGETGYELEKYSPAWEDFILTVTAKNLVQDIQQAATDFNADEHAEQWVRTRYESDRGKEMGIPDIRTLVKDADEIQEMLDALAGAVSKVMEGYV